MNVEEFEYHFPFDTPRKIQQKISQAVIKAFEDGFKHVVLQAPTGIGKSPIGYAVASYMNDKPIAKDTGRMGAYILTSMKGLQDQYMNDFHDVKINVNTFETVKGKANYKCIHGKQSCETGPCTKKMHPDNKNCPYIYERTAAYAATMSVLNYSYFFNMTYEKTIQPAKQLLILDECHNVENQLLKFASVDINVKEFKDAGLEAPKFPSMKSSNPQTLKWLKDTALPFMKALDVSVQIQMEPLQQFETEYQVLKKQNIFLTNMIGMIDRLLIQSSSGVTIVLDRDGNKSIGFKPLRADTYAKEFLFSYGSKVLMMSATVLNIQQYCKNLGLDTKEVKFIKVPSPFPLERRPIVNCAKHWISKKTLDTVKGDLVEQVKELLARHKDERGVIHSQSYDLAKFVVEQVNDPRLFIPKGVNRDKEIKEFLEDELASNGVIVSPSIKEGFDFKDDSARFCILLKAPYANLGDNFVKKRFTEDANWYYMEALRDVIQSVGRVVRHKKDYAVTYFLDKNIMKLIMNNRRYVPTYWTDSIVSEATFKWEPEKFDE